MLRDSNATAENWFKIVKVDLFDSESKLRAPRFIQRLESILEGRLKERKYSLDPTRRTPRAPKIKRDENLSRERNRILV